ncbi:MAG: hypothetical protein JXA49_07315 [Actinobacteria bacterium]|nr:hypothetical protein [Actinomycetota bacterium]
MHVIHCTRSGLVSILLAVLVLIGAVACVCSRPVEADRSGSLENLFFDFTGIRSSGTSAVLKGTFPEPTVTGINPAWAVNAGTVRITDLTGTGFRDGARVFLVGSTGMSTADSSAIIVEGQKVTVHSDIKITCEFELKGAPAGTYDVKVENEDGKYGELPGAFSVKDPIVQPGPAPASSVWYLAEGSTAWGFHTYISVENPNDEDVEIEVTYNTDRGLVPGGTFFLAPMSQGTLNPGETLGERDFSTTVTSTGGQPIAVDRTMEWGKDAGNLAVYIPEAHNSIGVTAPAAKWYLPEGSSARGFECWLLIQNPNDTEATCQVTYMIEGEGPVTVEKNIPANARRSYSMADDIGAKDASIKVDSNIPVIPERAMYRNNRNEGHGSIGTTTPANDYCLAEGAIGYGSNFTTYILIQNPNDIPNNVSVTFVTGGGEVAGPVVTMDPNSRKTIRVNDYLPPDTDVSTHVHGDFPVIAERAMYWDSQWGESCHDSIGQAQAHAAFYLPDGNATPWGDETWTLVLNPNDSDIEVEISYLTSEGTGNKTFTAAIPANSRRTFNMADQGIDGRASVLVTSRTAGKKIMCERSMYWDSRTAGTATTGGFSD